MRELYLRRSEAVFGPDFVFTRNLDNFSDRGGGGGAHRGVREKVGKTVERIVRESINIYIYLR